MLPPNILVHVLTFWDECSRKTPLKQITMLDVLSSILFYSSNVFCPLKEKSYHFATINFVVCKCFQLLDKIKILTSGMIKKWQCVAEGNQSQTIYFHGWYLKFISNSISVYYTWTKIKSGCRRQIKYQTNNAIVYWMEEKIVQENIVEIRENTGDQHFPFFPQSLQKLSY